MNNNNLNVYKAADGTWSFLPFYLPVGKSGKFEVHHEVAPKGSSMCVVSVRNAIFMGLPQARAVLEHDTIVHRLSEDDVSDAWMTTRPQEQEQHIRQLRNAHGNVLVGGLGLGMAVGILMDNPRVQSITVVELSEDVINLVDPYLPEKRRVRTLIEQEDLMAYLKRNAGRTRFDFAFYDTWCGTGQTAYVEDVLPLRQASKGIVPQDMIECWNEDEMIGQIAMSMNNWVGPEREVIRKMMWKDENPFDQPPEKFRAWASCSTGLYPFLAWMHKERPANGIMEEMAKFYLDALKNAVIYDENWKHYEDYGKES